MHLIFADVYFWSRVEIKVATFSPCRRSTLELKMTEWLSGPCHRAAVGCPVIVYRDGPFFVTTLYRAGSMQHGWSSNLMISKAAQLEKRTCTDFENTAKHSLSIDIVSLACDCCI